MRDQRLVGTLVELSLPFEDPRVETSAENLVDSAHRHGSARSPVGEPLGADALAEILQRIPPGRIPLEHARDDPPLADCASCGAGRDGVRLIDTPLRIRWSTGIRG
jgi:hypothetical protein